MNLNWKPVTNNSSTHSSVYLSYESLNSFIKFTLHPPYTPDIQKLVLRDDSFIYDNSSFDYGLKLWFVYTQRQYVTIAHIGSTPARSNAVGVLFWHHRFFTRLACPNVKHPRPTPSHVLPTLLYSKNTNLFQSKYYNYYYSYAHLHTDQSTFFFFNILYLIISINILKYY